MFQRLMNTIARFMVGRYGTDHLNRGLFILYFVLWLVSGLFRRTAAVGIPLTIVMWAVLGVLLFRTLSRNIPRRQAENQRFLRWWLPTKEWFGHQWVRLRDIRRCRYRRCPSCRAQLRLPIKRGRRTVTCFRCRAQFRTFFL